MYGKLWLGFIGHCSLFFLLLSLSEFLILWSGIIVKWTFTVKFIGLRFSMSSIRTCYQRAMSLGHSKACQIHHLLLVIIRAMTMIIALKRNIKSNAYVVWSISLKIVPMSTLQYSLPIRCLTQTCKPNLRTYKIPLYVPLSIRQRKLLSLSLLLNLATCLICRFILILNQIMHTLLPHLLQTILLKIVGLQIWVLIPMSAII